MPHDYTVQKSDGTDVHFQTESHHSSHASIEDFIKAHKEVIGLVTNVAGTAILGGISLWLGRGKTGTKLK